MLLRIVILLTFSIISLNAVAAKSHESEAWVSAAKRQNLSINPTWLKLGHYKDKTSSQTAYSSEIHSKNFFIASNGMTDPQEELFATIEAMFTPLNQKNRDAHPQCQFPARYLWLKKHLQNTNVLPAEATCPSYNEWTHDSSIESLSVIYATGYLGNPASFYGHTFLKFNSANNTSSFLDKTINYGAVVPDGENPVTYIFKGIFGGYIGGFSDVNFYFQNNNYGENELRDLWEYRLDLPTESVRLIVAHSWEVLKKEYTYFFFRKNCAYRMAELIELAEGVNIIKSRAVTFPQSLIKTISESYINNRPLVLSKFYHASRQTRLYQKYLALNANEKALVHQIFNHHNKLYDNDFIKCSITSKYLILDTLLDYLQYVRTPEDRNTDTVNSFYQQVLIERYKLPPGEVHISKQHGYPPDKGRDPSLVQSAITHNSKLGDGISLIFRPAYYDVLDSDNSHVRDSALTMGRFELHSSQGGNFELRDLTLIEIESINAAVTGLPEDNGSGWFLKAGLQPPDLTCTSCLIMRGQAYYGYSKRISNDILIGGFLGGQLQDSYKSSGNTRIAAKLFTNLFTGKDYNMRILIDTATPLDGAKSQEYVTTFLSRYRLSRNSDIRLSYKKDKAEEYNLTFGLYF
ncbi:protein of unknown function [Amphritea atlantica]|uniref:Uncharacterized protein n=1 Tax=Amphritea atlantica TaxID=355243 RepID=A0A1H9GUS9_9GAMM|nr:DUF4105 domain-containing protein [Amphritea atlantica]SEQ53768.1 protein of unknown function [Amphritea atlantica]